MVKGRRYRLVYSNRPPFDTRTYGQYVYTNNFESLVVVICSKEIEEAKKRIKANKTGTFYKYSPSKEYKHALNRFHKPLKNQNYVEVKQVTGDSG